MPGLNSNFIAILEDEKLDIEWVELILTALEIGISIEEIRAYLNKMD